MAGVMPDPSKGANPWEMLRDYVRNQETARANNDRATYSLEAQRRNLDPNNEYQRQSARGRAGVDTALYAESVGLDANGKSRGGGASSGRYNGKLNLESAEGFKRGLVEGGLSNPYGLAAALGNAQIESAGFNTRVRGDNGTALGGMQWREDREQRLYDFAKKLGGSWDDPYIQGRFAAWEMQNTEKPAGQIIMNARSLDEAQDGMQKYLRMKNYDKGSGAMNYAERVAASQAWTQRLQGFNPKAPKDPKADPNAPLIDPKWTRNDADPPNVFRDPDGRRWLPQYQDPAKLMRWNQAGAMPGGEDFQKLAKKYALIEDGRPNAKGLPPFKYYLDDPVAPGMTDGKNNLVKPSPAPAEPATTSTVAVPNPTPAPVNVAQEQQKDPNRPLLDEEDDDEEE